MNGQSAPPAGDSGSGSGTPRRASRSHIALAVGPGTVLRDRYRLTGILEVGEAATVHRAEDIESSRTVAVAVFQTVGRNDRGRIDDFHRPRPRGVAPLELPSAFAAVYACNLTDDGRLFLVGELPEGPTVADLARRTPPLPPARALEVAMRVGEAVEVVLNLGVLDLRVAPQDVVVVNDGDRVKLRRSDMVILQRLGLAEALTAAEAPGRDPRYASPEELARLPATERSLVYRFGILLYELLGGRPPFEGSTATLVRDQQTRPLPMRLRDRHPDLPASLDRLVARMLAPDPDVRPVDLTWILNEIWDAACQVGVEEPGTATEVASADSSTPPVAGRRTRNWALVALSVLVIGAAFLAGPRLISSPTGPPSKAGQLEPLAKPTSSPPDGGPVLSPSPPGESATLTAPMSSPVVPHTGGTGGTSRLSPPAPAPAAAERPPAARSPSGGDAKAKTSTPLPSSPAPGVRSVARPAPGTPPEVTPVPATATPSLPPQPDRGVPGPPARPRQPAPDSPRAADPSAIIEWLVRDSPRGGD